MSLLADEMVRGIVQLLGDVAESGTLRRVTTGSYVPGTGTGATDTNDDESVKVTFVERRDRFAQLLDQATGSSSVVEGKRRALLSAKQSDGVTALSKQPAAGDLLLGVDDTVKIAASRPIRLAGSVVAYVCEAAE